MWLSGHMQAWLNKTSEMWEGLGGKLVCLEIKGNDKSRRIQNIRGPKTENPGKQWREDRQANLGRLWQVGFNIQQGGA